MSETLQQLQLIDLYLKIAVGVLSALSVVATFLIRHFYKRLKTWFLALFARVDATADDASSAKKSSALAAVNAATAGTGLEQTKSDIAELKDQLEVADRRFEGAINAMDRMAGRHDSLLAAFLRQEAANRLVPDLKMRVDLITEYLGEVEKERAARRPRTTPTTVQEPPDDVE